MGYLAFREPLSRRQCVVVMLIALLATWVYAVVQYAPNRPGAWKLVHARVIEARGGQQPATPLILYEFDHTPYIAPLPVDAHPAEALVPGIAVGVFINEADPSTPYFQPTDQTRTALMKAAGLLAFSLLALYLVSRLMKTLEVERFSKRSLGNLDSFLEEFSASSGWSEALIELLSRQQADDARNAPTRASGGSGTLIGP